MAALTHPPGTQSHASTEPVEVEAASWRKLRLLVLSDLHLDHAPFDPVQDGVRIDRDADVVVLAGDIDEGAAGIVWARKSFPDLPIIYVPGNHEMYGQNFTRARQLLREAARRADVKLLDRGSTVIEGVRFLGSTLWTDFRLLGDDRREACMDRAARGMNDYRKITKDHEEPWMDDGPPGRTRKPRQSPLEPVDTAHEHELSVTWLREQLDDGSPSIPPTPFTRTVVVTHHAPHARSVPPEHEGHELSPSYASDLTSLMGKPDLWIHGHIHIAVDYLVNGTRVVCNPRGYPDDSLSPDGLGFDSMRRFVV